MANIACRAVCVLMNPDFISCLKLLSVTVPLFPLATIVCLSAGLDFRVGWLVLHAQYKTESAGLIMNKPDTFAYKFLNCPVWLRRFGKSPYVDSIDNAIRLPTHRPAQSFYMSPEGGVWEIEPRTLISEIITDL
jgi:hypothetical protein